MFEKLLQKLLKEVAGEFIEGIDLNKLNIDIWSGTVQIFNVSLKPKILAILGLPYSIVYSNISKLSITIPWKNLFSAPLVVEIESIQILVTNQECRLTKKEQSSLILLKLKQFIQKIGKQIAKKVQASTATDKNPSYFQSVYSKMIDNLYLTVKNIHFRLEAQWNLYNNFVFGATFQLMELYSVNSKGQKQFIDRSKLPKNSNQLHKQLNIKNCGVYWNQQESVDNMHFKYCQTINIKNYLPQFKDQKPIKDKKFLKYKKLLNVPYQNSALFNYLLLLNMNGTIEENLGANTTKVFRNLVINSKPLKVCVNYQILEQLVYLKKQIMLILLENLKQESKSPPSSNLDPQFVELLKKYCVSEFKSEFQSSPNQPVISNNNKQMFQQMLYENRHQFDVIQQKVKQFIVMNIGEKGNLTKSEIVDNWCRVEAALKKQSEGTLNRSSIFKVYVKIPEIQFYYLSRWKQPILSVHLKSTAIRSLYESDTILDIELAINKIICNGFGGNQIMGVQSKSTEDCFVLKYCKNLLEKQKKVEIQSTLCSITFNYDYKTIKQIISISQLAATPTSIAHIESERPQTLNPKNLREIPLSFTLTVNAIAVMITVQKEEFWQILFNNNLLSINQITTLSTKLTVQYKQSQIIKPIPINLSQVPDQNCFVLKMEQISLQCGPELIRPINKLINSLFTFKKADLLFICSSGTQGCNYGQLYFLTSRYGLDNRVKDQEQHWKKFDAFFFDGNIYLFVEGSELSYQILKNISGARITKKNNSKIDILQIQNGENQNRYKASAKQASYIKQWEHSLTQNSKKNKDKGHTLQKATGHTLQTVTDSLETHVDPPRLIVKIQYIKVNFICDNQQKQHLQATLQISGLNIQSLNRQKEQKYRISADFFDVRDHQHSLLSCQTISEDGKLPSHQSMLTELSEREQKFEIKIDFKSKVFLNLYPLSILQLQKMLDNLSVLFQSIQEFTLVPQSTQHHQIKPTNNIAIEISGSDTLQVKGFNILDKICEIIPSSDRKKEQQIVCKFYKPKISLISYPQHQLQFSVKNSYFIWKDRITSETLTLLQTVADPSDSFHLTYKFGNTLNKSSPLLFMKVLKPIVPQYRQQIILRFVDYLLCQVKDPVLAPFTFNQVNNQQKIIKTRNQNYQDYLSQKMKVQAILELCRTKIPGIDGLQIWIEMVGLRLHFDQSDMMASCQKLTITNKDSKIKQFGVQSSDILANHHYNNSIKKKIQTDQYYVIIEELGIAVCPSQKQSPTTTIVQKSTVILVIDVFSKLNEYKAAYRSFINQNILKVFMKIIDQDCSVVINHQILQRHIMNLLRKNIRYDDQKPEYLYSYDAWLKHTYNVYEPSSPILFDLTSNQIVFLWKLIQSQEIVDRFQELVSIKVDNLAMTYKQNMGSSTFSISIGDIWIKKQKHEIVSLKTRRFAQNCHPLQIVMQTDKQLQQIQNKTSIVCSNTELYFTKEIGQILPLFNPQNKQQPEIVSQNHLSLFNTSSLIINKVKIVYPLQFNRKAYQSTNLCLSLNVEAKNEAIIRGQTVKSAKDISGSEIGLFFEHTNLAYDAFLDVQEGKVAKKKYRNILQLPKISMYQQSINKQEGSVSILTQKVIIRLTLEDITNLSKIVEEIMFITNQLGANKKTNINQSSLLSQSSQSYKNIPPSRSSNNKMIRNIKFKSIQILVLSENMDSMVSPLLYASIDPTILPSSHQNDIITFKVTIVINYYNQRINVWQPLLQPTSLQVGLGKVLTIQKYNQKGIIDDNHSQISEISANNTKKTEKIDKTCQYININLTTNFVETLCTALKQQDHRISSKRFSDIDIDEINSWIIVNQLGLRIDCSYCQSLESQRNEVTIQNGRSKKICKFESNISYKEDMKDSLYGFKTMVKGQLETNSSFSKEMKVDIIIDKQFRIRNLEIGSSQIGLKRYLVEFNNRIYFIYRHIYVDISKNVRYIKFYSGVMIVNLTKSKLFLDINSIRQQICATFSGQQEEKVVQMEPKKQIYLPIGFEKLGLIKGEYYISKALSRSDIQSSEDLPKDVYIVQRQTRRMRTIFKVYPGLKVVNRLPQTLSVAMKINNKIINSFTLQTEKQEYLFVELNEQLQMSLYIDDYQWTDFITCIEQREVSLIDYRNNCTKVKFSIGQLEEGTQYLIVYPVAIFVNKCHSNILIDQSEQSALKNKNSKSQSLVVKPNQEVSLSNYKFLALRPQKCEQYLKISMISGKQIQELLFTVDNASCQIFEHMVVTRKTLKNNKEGEEIDIKYVTIAPKFSICNHINHEILIKKYQASNKDMRILEPKRQQPLYFLGSDLKQNRNIKISQNTLGPTVSKDSLFQITLNKQEYEWSGAISINKVGDTYFLLRSRSQYNKKLFFICCTVVKFNYMNRYTLEFKGEQRNCLEIPREIGPAVPYILKNKLFGYDIWIPEFTSTRITPNQKICLSWDEPIIKNQSFLLVVTQSIKGQISYKNFRSINSRKALRTEIMFNPNKTDQTIFSLPSKRSSFLLSSQEASAEINCHNLTSKCKLFEIRVYKKKQRQTNKKFQIITPLCIGIINNSFTPAYHLCDITVDFSIKGHKIEDNNRASIRSSLLIPGRDEDTQSDQNKQMMKYQFLLKNIQIDNQITNRVYFPVVMSTSISAYLMDSDNEAHKNYEMEIQSDPIVLNIEEEFALQCYAMGLLLLNIMNNKNNLQKHRTFSSFDQIQGHLFNSKNLQTEFVQQNQRLFISKLKLPKLQILLQVKTKKLAIETTISLQQPQITRYPWPNFPYPMSNIIINLLSNLSISPLAVLSSLKKGVAALLTEQETTRGFENFFGQIIGAITNTVTGVIGIVVGHDIEMVQDFFDGIDQGTDMLIKQFIEIKDAFEPEQCTGPALIRSFGHGVIGIVFKPIKGILQMTLKISQGIKKTALYSFDSKKFYKKRNSIVFYGPEERIYTYNYEQSQYKAILLKSSGQTLNYFHIVRFFVLINHLEHRRHLLAIGSQQLVLIDMNMYKHIFNIELDHIEQICVRNLSEIWLYPQKLMIQAVDQKTAQEILNILLKNQKRLLIEKREQS